MLPARQEPGWYRGRYCLVPSDYEGAGLFLFHDEIRWKQNSQAGLPKLEISEGERT